MALLLGLVALVLANAGAPRLPAEPRAPGEFSIDRAVMHVRALTATPGQSGSAGNAERRRYILERLSALGIDAQVQSTDAVVRLLGKVVSARVHNVVARIPGIGRGPAVMLCAHYDAVPNSPGASDDAAGVATLLEAARVLRAGAGLQRDVVFLFTDGEELALLGADAFVNEHPLRDEIGLALNFEARGASGASAMYETSLPNRDLVRELSRAAPSPVANSLLSSLSRALPNDTDFTIFRRHGIAGYAFAYADGFSRYHRHTDTVEHLDPRSLAHHGSYATHLARALANAPDAPRAGANVVYFDVFSKGLFWYPEWFAQILGALAALGAALVGVLALRAKWARLRGLAWGVLGCPVSVLLAMATALLLDLALGVLLVKDRRVEWAAWLFPAHLALALAGCFELYRWLLRRASGAELLLGSLFWGALLSLALGFWLPGASYAPQWLTLAALGGFWAAHRRIARGFDDASVVWLGWASLVPASYFVAAVGYALFVLMGTQLPPFSTLAVGWGAALFLPWCSAHWLPSVRRLQVGLLAIAGAAAAVLLAAGRAIPAPPSFSDLVYVLEADTQRAHWVASPTTAFDWTRRAVGETPSVVEYWRPKRQLARTAPAVVLGSSNVTVVSDGRDGSERRLTLSLVPPAGARCVSIQELGSATTRVGSINTKMPHVLTRFGEQRDREVWRLITGERLPEGLNLRYCGLDGRPLRVELVTDNQPLKLRVIDETDGLPSVGRNLPPRPEDVLFDLNGNRTLVTRDVTL